MENALARKIGTKRVVAAPIPEIELLANRMGRSFENALSEILNVPVGAMVLDCEVTKMSEVAAEIPAPAMLGVFHFVGSDHSALVNMTSDLAYHVIDLRMGGDPSTCPTTTTRSFTAIDEALCESVLRSFAASFEEATEFIMHGPLSAGFELRGIYQDVTAVATAPDSSDVLKICIALDVGVAARGGDIEFIVPLSVLDFVRSAVEPDKKETEISFSDIWKERMQSAVLEAELRLTAVLARDKYKPEFLQTLRPGTTLLISAKAPQSVALELNSHSNQTRFTVARARLGAFEGAKVVKLNESPSTQVIRHIRKAVEN